MLLRVINLLTGAERYFDVSLGPVAAVATAYAQSDKKDWNSWEYERKYFPLVRLCGDLFYLEDWVCRSRPD
ncbi:MAG TPA: hypothetical protein VKE74_34070 [Gemmataceae bacterium]|nr:hypothetical protein [Gemmataceae bacterium]